MSRVVMNRYVGRACAGGLRLRCAGLKIARVVRRERRHDVNANAVALGYQPSGDVHPTSAGYFDIAQVTANVIKAILGNTFAANDNVPWSPEQRRWAQLTAVFRDEVLAV